MKPILRNRFIYGGFAITLILFGVMLLPFAATSTLAQDGQPIQYGDNLPGNVTGPEGQWFIFEGQAGEVADIQVLGFGEFLPTVMLQDGAGTILAVENNLETLTTIRLNYALTVSGTFYIRVNGVKNATGQFAISLTKGTRELPPPQLLSLDTIISGTVSSASSPAVYSFNTNPDNVTQLQIEARSDGYNPVVSILNINGDIIFSVNNPQILGITLTFAPGNEAFQVVVEQGVYPEAANFDVALALGSLVSSSGGQPASTPEPSDNGTNTSGSGLGSTTPPAGCAITPANNSVNIRQGGSTDHPIVGRLDPGYYLSVTGYNSANGGWYEVTLPNNVAGWMGGSVTQRVGDCSNLPTKNFPAAPATQPTPPPVATTPSTGATATPTTQTDSSVTATITPTPTATAPSAQTAPPDSDPRYNFELNFKNNETRTISDTISYPDGDTTDRVTYRVTGFDSVTFSATSTITLVCTGPGSENARVRFGTGGGSVPCNGATSSFQHGEFTATGQFTVFLESGSGAYVTWTAVVTSARG